MKKIPVEKIKRLREETGAGVFEVKQALEKTGGDEAKARDMLVKKGFEKVAKKQERATAAGKIFSYVHHSGKIGAMVEILCETDFVARNELFDRLGAEVAMQVASMDPKNVKDLESQEYIRDSQKRISDLVADVIAKTGENIRINKFARIELGKSKQRLIKYG